MPHITVDDSILRLIGFLPLFIISISIHEFAHAYIAFRCGDMTARAQGRMTLNPLKHIDLFGTIVMPMLSFASGFAMIGWAKPVQINRDNFRSPMRDDLLVSAAGPVSNLILAFGILLMLIVFQMLHIEMNKLIGQVLVYGIYLNVFLFCFNMLPIPPLDGSHILYDLFPNEFTAKYMRMGLVGTIFILVILNTPLFGYFMKIVSYITTFILSLYSLTNL